MEYSTMKLLLAWVGFFLITFLLAVIGQPVWEFLNSYQVFRYAFRIIYVLGTVGFLGFILYVIGKDLLKLFKERRK